MHRLDNPWRTRAWLGLQLLCILGILAFIYLWHLGRAPVYVGGDEAHFANHAHAIATTGRDIDGRAFPLFFWMEELSKWYQPVLFYLIAAILKVAPLSEWSIRLPTALIGILDVALMYAVARKIFPKRWHATLAALMLAMTPAHVIFSRQAMDYICPLPFVLAWLWCVLAAIETDNVYVACAAGLSLGIGFYSYIGAWAMMPMLLGVTWIVFLMKGKRLRMSGATTIGFAVPFLFFLIFLRSHPEMLPNAASSYHLYDARLSPLQGVKDYLNYNNVQERVSVYWNYFDPSFLLLVGGSNLTHATRRAGVFLVPLGILLACGIYPLWRRSRREVAVILLAGFFLAPLPATLIDTKYAIQRELPILLFGVLIAVHGAVYLWQHPNIVVRSTGVLLLLLMPLSFGAFYRDYHTGYQIRSAYWFDPTDFQDVAATVTSLDAITPLPAVYLSNRLDDGPAHWRFRMTMANRPDLWRRSRFVDHNTLDPAEMPLGSVLVLYATEPRLGDFVGSDRCCSVVSTIVDVAGGKPTVVVRRDR